MTLAPAFRDFKVADFGLVGFGRTEFSLAEHEMPGLMALRAEHEQPRPWPGPASPGRCT
jgi:adenosylhomocysteinase